MTAKALAERDYFTDPEILVDPYQYFEAMRPQGPICRLEQHDCLLITGFEEALEVWRNPKDFSAVNSLAGAAFPLPFVAQGSDISEQLEENRSKFVGHDLVVCYDGEHHTKVRSLISRVFTPTRLKANKDFMHDYANELVQRVVAKGQCELVGDVAAPYVTMIIASLLGVPPKDREKFEELLAAGQDAGSIENSDQPTDMTVLHTIGGYMAEYLQDRMQNPTSDMLSELTASAYPDGSKPDFMELISLATFLFAAGQDTSAKLLGNAMRYIVDVPGLQEQLRVDRELIPWMIEEVLRLEGSSKITARLAVRDTKIGDRHIPAGTRVALAIAAVNRDPRRWGEDANEFKLKRPRIQEHLAFGRGVHTCAGAPLARAEVIEILNAFFDHTSHIGFSEEKHGKPGERKYQFEPSFIIRGLDSLYVEFNSK